MNPYELMIGSPPSTQDEIKVAAARLRGMDDQAVLAMLSGDSLLGNVGKLQYESTQENARGIGKARAAADNLTAQREMDNARLAQQDRTANENNAIQRSQLAATIASQNATRSQTDEQNKQNKLRDDADRDERIRAHNLAAEAARERADLRAEAAKATKDRFDDIQVRMLSDKMQSEGITDLEGAVDTADQLAGKYFSVDTGKRVEGNIDIPGFGGMENLVPTWASGSLGKDAKQLRLYMKGVSNRVLKARSGSAVTSPEMQRLAEELGHSIGQSEEEMMQAYVNFRKGLKHVKSGIFGGRDPDVVDTYERQRGAGAWRPPDAMGAGTLTGTLATQRGTPYEVIE